MARGIRVEGSELEPFILGEGNQDETTTKKKLRLFGKGYISRKYKLSGIGAAITLFLLLYVIVAIKVKLQTTEVAEGDPLALRNALNDTLGFEKVFVVALPDRQEQRDALEYAGSLTGLSFEYVDANYTYDASRNALRAEDEHAPLPGNKWGCHINALQRVVHENLTSALILEDTADWDVRIKLLMQHTARATKALTQPLKGEEDHFEDPTYPIVHNEKTKLEGVILDHVTPTEPPKLTTYGDNWDIILVGHCGMRRPQTGLEEKWAPIAAKIPKGFLYTMDLSVPEPHYIHVTDNEEHWRFRKLFSNHTRVWHHAMDSHCSTAYAVSQRGAKKLLSEFSTEPLDAQFDGILRRYCDRQSGHEVHTCITVRPTLFDQFRPAVYDGEVIIKNASTNNIRWSTRLNLEKLAAGEEHYYDQFPDWLQYLKDAKIKEEAANASRSATAIATSTARTT